MRTHFHAIRRGIPAYRGMPFYAAWDPTKGGTHQAGANWIITNLGKRPTRTDQLHIVDRRLGFVPGNLQWVPRKKHRQSEMIARLLREIQTLKKYLRTIDPNGPYSVDFKT